MGEQKSLSGAVAIVTGGASGIGQAITRRLLEDGSVVVVGELPTYVEGIPGTEVMDLDVRDPRSVRNLVSHVRETHGRLDIVVSNAALSGTRVESGFLEHAERLFREVLDTNLVGPFLVMQAAAAAMVRDGTAGRLINIASVDGLRAETDVPGYVASKAGLIGLTRAAAVDLAPHRITVNAVAPGQIWTAPSREAAEARAQRGLAPERAPLGDDGNPEDVAAAVAYFASPGARWVTGTTLVVDGGRLAS